VPRDGDLAPGLDRIVGAAPLLALALRLSRVDLEAQIPMSQWKVTRALDVVAKRSVAV
jgi:hypothetical protein